MVLKENFVEIINRDCPICDKVHDVEHRIESAKMPIKREDIEYFAEYFRCPNNNISGDDSWTPAAMLDENLLRARDAYRIKNALLTSGQIVEIRKKYGFSQKELSNLLGWGDVTVARYETKLIQDETYDSMLRMIFNNPSFALDELVKHKNCFSDSRFIEIKVGLKALIKADGNVALKRQEIHNRYIEYDVECDANGFRLLDIDKVADVIAYFANYVSNLYKVKLMKLLWYSDMMYFNSYGKSITGLVYQHMPLGALPLAHGEIIYLPAVNVIGEESDHGTAFHIIPLENPANPMFSLEEHDILNKVALKLRDASGRDISSYMHDEEAYKITADKEIILYSQAYNIIPF